MISLKNSLQKLPELKALLKDAKTDVLKECYEKLDELQDIADLIDSAIVEEPPISIKEGGIIKRGYNSEIDEYRSASTDGKSWIIELEAKEREATGIKNLKVGYTRAFGYYIEVTKSFLKQVPDRFIRKQTLTNAERFITEELREMETKILGAEEKAVSLEYNEFVKIRDIIASNIERLQTSSSIISKVDVLSCLATVAEDNNYVRPEINDGTELKIVNGRHPVVEKMLGNGELLLDLIWRVSLHI